jgi:hypothetical protein
MLYSLLQSRKLTNICHKIMKTDTSLYNTGPNEKLEAPITCPEQNNKKPATSSYEVPDDICDESELASRCVTALAAKATK